MYSCDAKLNFQQPLQFSVSHDPSDIIWICWFGVQLLIIYNWIILILVLQENNNNKTVRLFMFAYIIFIYQIYFFLKLYTEEKMV